MVGLDGFDPGVANTLIARGQLPNLAALARTSAVVSLDHGSARYTGLAWEHVSVGRTPEAYGRFSATRFDGEQYRVTQEPTAHVPLVGQLDRAVVVLGTPYFDLHAAPNVRGMAAWGAHDPGVEVQDRPAGLAREVEARVGPYPATEYIYGEVWPHPGRTRRMGDALAAAMRLRGVLGRWLLAERLPEWDLGVIVFSEFHSLAEGLWHGWDPAHPLHTEPSARAAHDGIVNTYAEFDRTLGLLRLAFPDADLVAFSMHGMGINEGDVPTMLLLPELLYRHRFGSARFIPRPDWRRPRDGVPRLHPGEGWSKAVRDCLGETPLADETNLDWMPTARYRPWWPEMDAFAVPSFYDGRVRVNLAGRERAGRVALSEYHDTLDAIERLIRDVRDTRTGHSVVRNVSRPGAADPLRLDDSNADLIIEWQGTALGFDHPRLGRIGPAPFRRTGGHTGGDGVAYLTAAQIPRRPGARASSFDIVPTVVELLGCPLPTGTSGASLCGSS